MVPGWFISEMSPGGAKWDFENTPKATRLICISAPRSLYALLAVGWLWPSDNDGNDDDDGYADNYDDGDDVVDNDGDID